MIEYYFKEEKDYAVFYAKALGRSDVVALLESGNVKTKTEAQALSVFFWDMVDKSIENEKNNVKLPWNESAEFWNEKLLHTFSGYLESAGFIDVWDAEVDKH